MVMLMSPREGLGQVHTHTMDGKLLPYLLWATRPDQAPVNANVFLNHGVKHK
jgi:hypothetical protein